MPELTRNNGYNRDSNYLWQCPKCGRTFDRHYTDDRNVYMTHLLEHLVAPDADLKPIVVSKEG